MYIYGGADTGEPLNPSVSPNKAEDEKGVGEV